MGGSQKIAERVVSNSIFEYVIIALILASGAILGLRTVPEIADQFGDLMTWGNRVI